MKNNQIIFKESLPWKIYFSWKVIRAIIKTGIIKSNLIGTLAGLCLAVYVYEVDIIEFSPSIILTLIGTSLIVGGSGAINNFYDRDIDTIMKRTKNRPTADGSINPKFALWLGNGLLIIGLGLLLSVSYMSAFLGFLGFFLYVFTYTMLTKRKTIYNTEVGSLSGATPPLIGWAAISPDILHPIAIGLFALMFLWQPPHFYAIAIRRLEEYKAAGVPMLPVIKGIKRAKVQTIVYLVALLSVSFLFWNFSKVIALSTFGLTSIWLLLSILGFKKMDDTKWATLMFVFSLNHLTILFSLMIIVSFAKYL